MLSAAQCRFIPANLTKGFGSKAHSYFYIFGGTNAGGMSWLELLLLHDKKNKMNLINYQF